MKRFTILCCLLFLPALLPIANAQVNLLSNPSFETQGDTTRNAQSWSEAGNYQRNNWRHTSGSWQHALTAYWDGGNDNGLVYQRVPCAPGKSYTAGGWFWADSDWSAEWQVLQLSFYDSDGGNLGDFSTPLSVSPAWTWHEKTAVAPANAAWVEWAAFTFGFGSSGALQFDDALLYENEPAVLYPGPTSRKTGIIISEIMYNPPDRPDGLDLEFIELFNTEPIPQEIGSWRLSGEVDFTFPADTLLPGRSFLVIAKDPESIQTVYGITNVTGPFSPKLGNASGDIRLRNNLDAILLELTYGDQSPWPAAADGAGHSLVLDESSYGENDPRSYAPSAFRGGSPGDNEPESPTNALPLINEFLAHTDLPDVDYIELYNPGDSTLDVSGFILSDKPADTNGYIIPAGHSISPRGFRVYYETNLGFALSADGEAIFLLDTNQNRVVDALAFPGQQNGVSCGRHPDGAPGLHPLVSPTPGTNNSPRRLNNIVINEIMYDPISGDSLDEYIELYNRSSESVNLGYWSLDSAVTFPFPADTIIPGHGYLVIAADATRLISNHPGTLNAGNTIGNFSGKLGNSGERILLMAPDTPNDPADPCRFIADEVTYRPGVPGCEDADGRGSSLELRNPDADNLLDMNWQHSDESSKSSWITNELTGTLSQGMLAPSTSINKTDLFLLGAGECLVDDAEVVRSGVNRVLNSNFDAGFSNWTNRGNHVSSTTTTTGAYSGARSLLLNATGGGDTKANRLTGNLSTSLSEGNTITLRCKARWLRGNNLLLMRVLGNYLETIAELPIPRNLGTPGLENSSRASNLPPALFDVSHTPPHPTPSQSVRVSARAHDPDGLASVTLRYRLDPSTSFSSLTMTQDATGCFTATLPGQSSGTLVAWHVRAVDALSATGTFPRDLVRSECLTRFDTTQLPASAPFAQYTIWMRQADMTTWASRPPLSDQLLPATFVCGTRIAYDASIRFRGSPFVRPIFGDPASTNPAAYRVEFAKHEPFLGVTELNLDWQEPNRDWERDSTFQRERAAFHIAHAIGLPSINLRYVDVCLNGLPRGVIYTDSQHPDADYIASVSPDADGTLLKINDWFELNYDLDTSSESYFSKADASLVAYEISGALNPARYRWNWEVQHGSETNFADFFTLVSAANLSAPDYRPTLETVCDISQWMATIAFRHALADWDSFGYDRGKNMLAFRPDAGRWKLINWDIDYGMGRGGAWDYEQNLFQVAAAMPHVNAMIQHPPFKRAYWQALEKIVAGPLTSSRLFDRMDATYSALLAQGKSVDSPNDVKTWLYNRRNYIRGQLYSLTNFSLYISTADFTSSSNHVTIAGGAPVQDRIFKLNGVIVQPEWPSDETHWTLSVALSNGINNLTLQGCDENAAPIPGQSDSIQITCNAADPDPADYLRFSEIMYHPPESGAEFIEIHNRSANSAFELAGHRIAGADLTFTQSVVIAPRQYLVVAADPFRAIQAYGPSLRVAAQWNGNLSNDGEWLSLNKLDTNGALLATLSSVLYNDAAPWPKDADGAGPSLQARDLDEDINRVGNWAVDLSALATPGLSNSVATNLPPFPLVRINEIQPRNASTLTNSYSQTTPWIELHNPDSSPFDCSTYYLTDDYTNLLKAPLPAISISTNSHQLFWADASSSLPPEYHLPVTLPTNGGALALVHLYNGTPIIVDYLNYDQISLDKSYGNFPDSAWTNRETFFYPSPGRVNTNTPAPAIIYINEWMADPASALTNPATGACDDWFELYNAEDYPVEITGYSLTDNTNSPAKFRITGATTLAPREFRLVWADNTASANAWGTNPLHAAFALSKSGEAIALYTPDGALLDHITFGAQSTGISQGRYPDGASAPFSALGLATPAAANILDPALRYIVATCSANGQIAPAGTIQTSLHSSILFTLTAAPWYAIADILTNSASIGGAFGDTQRQHTWSDIQQNGEIHVVFSPLVTSNGTPLHWLAQFGLTNHSPESEILLDPDADGVPTWQEYIAQTDPTNAASLFELAAARQDIQEYTTLSWLAASNRYYTLYRYTNLLAEPLILYNRMPPTPPLNTYTDLTATTKFNFYKVKVEP